MKESNHHRRRAPSRSLLLMVCTLCILSIGSGNVYAGYDFVFVVDVTLSTADWLPTLKQDLKNGITMLQAAAPGSRFGIASHLDYPFGDYGAPGEHAYRRECSLTANVPFVNGVIDGLTSGNGGDSPESQYEAIYQALLGLGRDLNGDGDFGDPGEIDRKPMRWMPTRSKVLILFTWPVNFHDPDIEPDYPYTGSQRVAGFPEVVNAMAVSQPLLTFGLVPGPGGPDPQSGGLYNRGRDQLEEVCDSVFDIGEDMSGFDDAIEEIIVLLPPEVPSSTEWGLIVLFGMLVLSGVWILLWKRRAALTR